MATTLPKVVTWLMAGSGPKIRPLAASIGEAFTKLNPGVGVEVTGGGSAAGIQALIDGRVEIAASSSLRLGGPSTVSATLDRPPGTTQVSASHATACGKPRTGL